MILQHRSARRAQTGLRLRWLTPLVCYSLVFLLAANGAAYGAGQGRGYRRQFVQTSIASDSAAKTHREGRDLIADEKWAQAAEKFTEVIARYPNGEHTEAALYWLAFALKKQEKWLEADAALARLLQEFPRSSWRRDAQTLRLEIAPRLGKEEMIVEQISQGEPDEIKIVALQSLFEINPQRARTLAAELLKPNAMASQGVQEAARMLLDRASGKRAAAVLVDVAPGANSSLRRLDAIAWLTIKPGARQLALHKGRVIKLDGAGELRFKRDGQLVEVPAGLAVMVNGEPVSKERIVRGDETVRLASAGGKKMWELSLASTLDENQISSGQERWINFSGELALSHDEFKTYLLQLRPDGSGRLRLIPTNLELGVTTEPINEALAVNLGLTPGEALLIIEVSPNTLADQAGLKKFDLLTHIDGRAAATEARLREALSQKGAGETLKLRLLRSGKPLDVDVVLPAGKSGNASPAVFPVTDSRPAYQIAVGLEPQLVIANGNGELMLRCKKGHFTATINGQSVPSDRLVRQDSLIRVLGADDETLFAIGIFPTPEANPKDARAPALIYSPDLDPFTSRARIGATTESVGEALAAQLGINRNQALLVKEVVKGMSADKAGLRKFDVISQINGQPPASQLALDRAVSEKKPGEPLRLGIIRNGQPVELMIAVEVDKRWRDFRELQRLYLQAREAWDNLIIRKESIHRIIIKQ